jgi:hypothetical protein
VNWNNNKAHRLFCIETDDHISRVMNMKILSLYISINIKSNIYTRLTYHENTNVVLQPNVLDKWFWRSQHLDIFSVKGPYQYLTRREEDV